MERKQIGFEAFGCASWKRKLVSDTNSRCHFPLGEASSRIDEVTARIYPTIIREYLLTRPRLHEKNPPGSRWLRFQTTAIHCADEPPEASAVLGKTLRTAFSFAERFGANLALGFLRGHGARFGTPRLDGIQRPSRWLEDLSLSYGWRPLIRSSLCSGLACRRLARRNYSLLSA